MSQILELLSQSIPFVAFFAGLAAAIIMMRVAKKFAGGVLEEGFKIITFGVIFVVAGILLDAFGMYLMGLNDGLSAILLFVKGICFVVGTYIIVIGSKRMADKLESLQ